MKLQTIHESHDSFQNKEHASHASHHRVVHNQIQALNKEDTAIFHQIVKIKEDPNHDPEKLKKLRDKRKVVQEKIKVYKQTKAYLKSRIKWG